MSLSKEEFMKAYADYPDIEDAWQRYQALEAKLAEEGRVARIARLATPKGFLDELHEVVKREAPEWTSQSVPPYSFPEAHDFVRNHFPAKVTKEEFTADCAKWVRERLGGMTSYPPQAVLGWLIAVISNVLSEEGQQGVVLNDALPKIWDALVKNGRSDLIGDLFTPAVLDALNESDKPTLLNQISGLIEKHFDQPDPVICVLDPFTHDGGHIGVYSFEDEKRDVVRHFIQATGIPQLIEKCEGGRSKWLSYVNLIEAAFRWLDKDGCQQLAAEMDRQIGRDRLVSDFSKILLGQKERQFVYPLHALRIFSGLMQYLPASHIEPYAQGLVDRLGKKLIPCIAATMSWMDDNREVHQFVEVLPSSVGLELVQAMANRALSADYIAADGNYGDFPNSYTDRANFATTLHTIIPSKYQAIFEGCVIDYLTRHQGNEGWQEALVKASLLLRHSLAKSGIRTMRDVDLYISESGSWVVAHIKPDKQNNVAGIVTTGQFIGTLEDCKFCVQPRGGFAPRYEPPNRREVFPREFHQPLIPQLEAADGFGMAYDQPTLLEVLWAR